MIGQLVVPFCQRRFNPTWILDDRLIVVEHSAGSIDWDSKHPKLESQSLNCLHTGLSGDILGAKSTRFHGPLMFAKLDNRCHVDGDEVPGMGSTCLLVRRMRGIDMSNHYHFFTSGFRCVSRNLFFGINVKLLEILRGFIIEVPA